MNDKELLTSDERADVLNLINRTLENNGFNLEVVSYEDIDGSFFNISLWKNYYDKPIVIKDKCETTMTEEDVIDRAATITEEEVIDCINDMMDGMPSDKCSDWIDACMYIVRALKELKCYREDKHSCECREYEENAENQIPCADCKHNHIDYFECRE